MVVEFLFHLGFCILMLNGLLEVGSNSFPGFPSLDNWPQLVDTEMLDALSLKKSKVETYFTS